MAFIDGTLIDDDYYFGRPWEIGLQRFRESLLKTREVVLVLKPAKRGASYLEDIPESLRPVFKEGSSEAFEFQGVELIPEYRARLSL